MIRNLLPLVSKRNSQRSYAQLAAKEPGKEGSISLRFAGQLVLKCAHGRNKSNNVCRISKLKREEKEALGHGKYIVFVLHADMHT